MMRRARLAALLVLIPLGGSGAIAQSSLPRPDTYTVDDLKRVEAERDEAMKRLKRLETEGRKAARAAAEVDRDLLAAAADSQRREEQASAAEARLVDLNRQVVEARSNLVSDRAALDDLLAALMTFGAHRPPALAASPEDAGTAVRAAILMGDVAPALSARAKQLSERIDQLNALVEDVKHEKATLAEADEALAARRQEIDALAEEKRLARVSLETETASLKARTDRLAREADTLHDLLDDLAAAAPAAPSAKPARTAATSSTRPDAAAAPRPNVLPDSPLATAPRPGAPAGSAPLVPVVGKQIREFGQKRDGLVSSGLTYATRPGAQVIAPLDARVEYAGAFRTYGQMLILDVGGDILVVVSGLGAIYPEAGQWVLAGEPIGRMADQKSPSPELYLEVRRKGQPVDPKKWLGRGA
ncbi:MAG: peptidoglycan DD-metalloendopeptidase family protein [Alphaproteobacteria bacterium]|nr:peptidoglycan DD-metalloendopeptidase family protein [Alphaproteobacteria bacterium]